VIDMNLKVVKTKLEAIQPLRNLFLQKANCQVRYNSCHERGWTDSYLLKLDGREVGYGSIKGQQIKERDTVFEFYLIHPFKKLASRFFQKLIAVSEAKLIECQSNDFFLSSLLFEFSQNISSDVVLFDDHGVTEFRVRDVLFRLRKKDDDMFEHKMEPIGEYVLEREGEVVATGGFALHYNMPFADLYMEVRQDNRQQGLGSYILQELKKECYLSGRVPSARCHISNKASKATLIKAGLKVCGFMLKGDIKNRKK